MEKSLSFKEYLKNDSFIYKKLIKFLDSYANDHFQLLDLQCDFEGDGIEIEVYDFDIKWLEIENCPGMEIRFTIITDVTFSITERTSHNDSNEERHQWLEMYCCGTLEKKFQDIRVLSISIYNKRNITENQIREALNQFFVPYIYSDSLEEIADEFTEQYCSDAIYHGGYRLPVDHLLQKLGMDFYVADLPDNCFGRMYFKPAKATVYMKYRHFGEVKHINHEIQAGTVLINRNKYFLGNNGTYLLTIAHEIIHWHLHQKYFQLMSLLDSEAKMMSCEVEPIDFQESMTMAQKAHWFAEWQANALAMRIAIPRDLMFLVFEQAKAAASPYHFSGEFVEDILERVAGVFDVPCFIVKQRARQLGFDRADGAFVYVDGKRHEPFWFNEGTLGPRQTFVIDKAGYKKLYEKNPWFKQTIDSGDFIYLGYVVCINDPKYIMVRFSGMEAKLILTAYAREHVDECCIVFSYRSTLVQADLQDKYEFYGESYLSKEVKSDNYVEYIYDKDFNDKKLQTSEIINEEVGRIMSAQIEEERIVNELVSSGKNFAETLIDHMGRKKITVEALAERSGLSDTTIKKYRAGTSNPPIENLMAVCIGLNLTRKLSEHLLSTCSFRLGNSPRDRAYNLCLDYGDGTLEQWNRILDACHQARIPNLKNQK